MARRGRQNIKMKAALETRKLKNSRAGRDADRYFNTKANKNSIPERHSSVYSFWKFYHALMISFMTGFTQCNQIIRTVTACLTAFYVMYV